MKRFICVLLSGLVLLSLLGCNKDKTDGSLKKKVDFTFGKTKGSVYENKLIGLGCEIPDGWKFYSDEKIKQINGIALDSADEKLAEELKNVQLIYDMWATSPDGSSSIIVNFEKREKSELKALNLKRVMRDSLEKLQQTQELEGETTTITIDGKEFAGLSLTMKSGANKMCQKQMAVKCDGYLGIVIFTAGSHDTVDNLIKEFYLLKK